MAEKTWVDICDFLGAFYAARIHHFPGTFPIGYPFNRVEKR